MKMKVTKFGQTVEKLQARRGLSNLELAKRLGVSPSRVSWLKATTKPHPMTVHKLSRAFDVDASIFWDSTR